MSRRQCKICNDVSHLGRVSASALRKDVNPDVCRATAADREGAARTALLENSSRGAAAGDCAYSSRVPGAGLAASVPYAYAAAVGAASKGCISVDPCRKKTVRFNRDHGGCALTKDSGIDTSSSATLNEDLCLKVYTPPPLLTCHTPPSSLVF